MTRRRTRMDLQQPRWTSSASCCRSLCTTLASSCRRATRQACRHHSYCGDHTCRIHGLCIQEEKWRGAGVEVLSASVDKAVSQSVSQYVPSRMLSLAKHPTLITFASPLVAAHSSNVMPPVHVSHQPSVACHWMAKQSSEAEHASWQAVLAE